MNDPDIMVRAARAAHEANRAYCAALDDYSQPSWEEAPEWQRESALAGVAYVMAHPDSPPTLQHECWLAEKRRDGWTYGAEKDAERKTHPCFLPYDELPESQRAKDAIFGAVVRGVLAHWTTEKPDSEESSQ